MSAALGLDRLMRGLMAIEDGTVKRAVIESAATTVQSLIAREFNGSYGPDGVGWKKLAKKREKGRPNRGGPLFDSGALKAAATSLPTITSDGFYITIDLPYAATHLYGEGAVPPRVYLPLHGRLGPQWTTVLDIVASREIRKFLP